jgi:hypothetical protein
MNAASKILPLALLALSATLAHANPVAPPTPRQSINPQPLPPRHIDGAAYCHQPATPAPTRSRAHTAPNRSETLRRRDREEQQTLVDRQAARVCGQRQEIGIMNDRIAGTFLASPRCWGSAPRAPLPKPLLLDTTMCHPRGTTRLRRVFDSWCRRTRTTKPFWTAKHGLVWQRSPSTDLLRVRRGGVRRDCNDGGQALRRFRVSFSTCPRPSAPWRQER